MNNTQPTQFDAAHFDSKARQWDDNPVFRERGLKIAEAIRSTTLPSTSPAHAAMPFEEKLTRWAAVLQN